MALLSGLIHRLRWHRHLHELADELAEQAFEQMWSRVAARVLSMSVAEARGYARVLAAAEAKRQAELTLHWLQLPGHWKPQLAALASEAVAARVAQRVQALQQPSRSVRRAA